MPSWVRHRQEETCCASWGAEEISAGSVRREIAAAVLEVVRTQARRLRLAGKIRIESLIPRHLRGKQGLEEGKECEEDGEEFIWSL